MQSEWYSVVTSNYFYPCFLTNILLDLSRLNIAFITLLPESKIYIIQNFGKICEMRIIQDVASGSDGKIKLGPSRHHRDYKWFTTQQQRSPFFAPYLVIIRVNISKKSKKQT